MTATGPRRGIPEFHMLWITVHGEQSGQGQWVPLMFSYEKWRVSWTNTVTNVYSHSPQHHRGP